MANIYGIQRILLLIIIYIYIYNPVFIIPGFGLLNLLLVLSVLYCFYSKNTFKRTILSYKRELTLTICMLFYVLLIKALNGVTEYNSISTMVTWILTTVIVPIFLVNTLFSRWKEHELLNTLLDVGFIAAMISVICLFSPAINELSRNIQIPDELENIQDGTSAFRCYGVATNLTSAYGIIQGVMASLALVRIRIKPMKYIIYFLIMTVSAAINARTGLLPIIITLFYVILTSIKRNFITTIPFTIVTALLISFLVNYLRSHFSDTFDFVFSFFEAIYQFITSGNVEGLPWFGSLEIFIRFPDSLGGVLFGEGYTIMHADQFENSDIGYINQIFLGGIVFLIMLLLFEIILYRNLWFRSERSVFVIILFITALLINFKGISFYLSNAYTRFVMLLYFYYSISYVNKKKNYNRGNV